MALEDNTQFLYKTTDYYAKDCEGAIVWNDESLAIDWQFANIDELLINEKDKLAGTFKDF